MIYTFGDGFAAGHIWPEWPQILEAVATQPVINQAYPGAGNDFIFSTALDTVWSIEQASTFIVQWAPSRRFDKLLQDDSWTDTISNDTRYSHAVYQVRDKKWWLSSGSDQMSEYHNKYQQQIQKTMFDAYHMAALYELLTARGHTCLYLLTYNFDGTGLDATTKQQFDKLPWINAQQGMDSVIDPVVRGQDVQPLPLGHAQWIQKYLHAYADADKLCKLIRILERTSWVAFDPDRDEQWNQIKKQLS